MEMKQDRKRQKALYHMAIIIFEKSEMVEIRQKDRGLYYTLPKETP